VQSSCSETTVPSFLENVASNRLTDQTIKRMFELVGSAVTDPKFQDLVYQIVGGLPAKDYQGEVRTILNWVKQNIRYTKDPYGVELVQDPWTTINRSRGDCDDMSILISAMGEVLGNPSHFVTVSTRPDREPGHVYSELNVKGRWLALDATVPGSSVGWKPSTGITDRRVWTRQDVGVSGYEDAAVEGIGMLNQWRQTVRPVKLTREPDDISHTYADMTSGTPFVSQRPQPGAPRAMVARYSDITEQPGPGGIPYDGHYPIVRQKTYKDAWSFIPREAVPIQLHAFGRMDPWKADWTKILPTPNVPEDRFMLNAVDSYAVGMAGLGDISEPEANAVVNAAVQDTAAKVAAGVIPKHQAEDHAKAVIHAVKTGDVTAVKQNPATAKAVIAIARRRGMHGGGGIFADPSLNWLPNSNGTSGGYREGLGEYYRKSATLGGLSDDQTSAIVDAAQADITSAVQSGAMPADAAPAAAAKVIDAVHSGDSAVVNPKNTPRTHAVMQRIKGGRGGGSAKTPATKPHHPVTGATVRRGYEEMRAQSQDYWDADPSLEWNPRMYGLGQAGGKVNLRKAVHSLVRQRLPEMARRAGVHPHKLAQVMGTRSGGVSGLGQAAVATVDPATVNAVANATTNALTGVVDPSSAAQVSSGVTSALNAILGQAGGSTGGFSFNLAGWGVPLLVLSGVGLVGYFMISRARKSKYKSNPSRRRSGGGKKGGNMKLLLIGGAAVAALMIFKKPAAPTTAAPQTLAQKLMSSVTSLFSTPSGQQQVSSAVTGISKLFSGSSTPSGTSSSSSSSSSAAPTDPFAANQQAQAAIDAATAPSPTDSGMVTSIDTGSEPTSD
jgi:hypothetical protein